MQFRPSQTSLFNALALRFARTAVVSALLSASGCSGQLSDDGVSVDNTDDSQAEGGAGGADGQSDQGGQGGSPAKSDAGAQPAAAGKGGDGQHDAAADKKDAPTDATGPDVRVLPAGLKPAIVAAGYGAFRAMSFDGGKTWKNRVVVNPNGGDDGNLIRAINYVEGMWVAAGWKIFLSEDGITWTEVNDQVVPGGWYDCVTSKDGRIIVKTIRSDYGGQNGGATYSDDRGKTWKEAKFATQCFNPPKPFVGEGFWLRSDGGILRSTNGSTWQKVLQDCCGVEAFANGMAVEK